jgi:hypothetical protein
MSIDVQNTGRGGSVPTDFPEQMQREMIKAGKVSTVPFQGSWRAAQAVAKAVDPVCVGSKGLFYAKGSIMTSWLDRRWRWRRCVGSSGVIVVEGGDSGHEGGQGGIKVSVVGHVCLSVVGATWGA